ncbi:MAG: phage portal protein [Candidatus Bathyarchaeota archaeon]|nr:phage portal protein [Candidatus Termiticorpusculum sp.]
MSVVIRRLFASLNPFSGRGNSGFVQLVQTVSDEDKLSAHFDKFNGLPDELKYYKTVPMLRRCIDILAGYVASAGGFDTVLEPAFSLEEQQKDVYLQKYSHVKAYVDEINKKVNLDHILFVACVKMCLYGKAGFKKVLDSTGVPCRLHVLPVANSDHQELQPVLNELSKELEGFKIQSSDGAIEYKVSDVLYFVNTDLSGNWQGISDLDELVPVCIIYQIMQQSTPYMLKRMRNPYVVASVDTSGRMFSEENVEKEKDALQKQLKALAEGIDSGSNVVTNNKVALEMVQLKIDLKAFMDYDDKQEAKIISYFGIPRFLVNEPNVNRATAETEFTAFVEGTVAVKQRYIKRVLESETWYDMLVRKCLGLSDEMVLPVKIKHVWRDIDMGNVKEKVDAAVALYGNGLGILGEHPDLAMKTAGLYTSEIAKCIQLKHQKATKDQTTPTQLSRNQNE